MNVSSLFDAGLALRWTLYVAILAVVGSVAFHLGVVGRARLPEFKVAACDARLRRLALCGAFVLLPVAAGRLHLQVDELRFEGDPWRPMAATLLNSTAWGTAWYIQVAAIVVAIVSLLLAARAPRPGWTGAAVASAVLVVTPALSGHASTSGPFSGLSVMADSMHVAGAGTWLGALLAMFVAVVVPVRRGTLALTRGETDALLTHFSPMALTAAFAVVASGVVSAWFRLEHLSALTTTAYGQVLLLKLGAVAVVFAVGWFNWRRVSRLENAAERLSSSAIYELFAAFLVIGITSVLVVTVPPVVP